MSEVYLSAVRERLGLKNLTPDIDLKKVQITNAEINRPALQLTGYFDHFDASRIQIIGFVEYTYIERMTKKEKKERFEKLLSFDIPCVIFSRDLQPDPLFLETANRHRVPVLSSKKPTSDIMATIILGLNLRLAPNIRIHGVLVDIFGEGVLITGESGIGKSEAALELIKRGHRLVSDDVVDIHRVGEDTLVGSAPELTKHFIELRGIGIIDVKTLFGVSAVRDSTNIDLVIRLEDWDKDKDYDRFGMEEKYVEYLGVRLVCHDIPVRPGRNLAVICESAAVNHRQKMMGYNAAKELYKRVQNDIRKQVKKGPANA
ncbi:MAG: HPr(Ser) kinase/phosphatase [Lachnospiraceae bacterium]|nr:HPr(Ser) kinase/phosphatase [Lachnospiraceae bacterium]